MVLLIFNIFSSFNPVIFEINNISQYWLNDYFTPLSIPSFIPFSLEFSKADILSHIAFSLMLYYSFSLISILSVYSSDFASLIS